ncbi:MAG: glycosyltransferase [Chitinivibrionales bacterium]|nr:glycosyltransferase [Chitinivibrionales bacterium]
MKIAFMNSIPSPVWRGGEKWMVTAAAGLHDRGHSVICIGKPDAVWLRKARDRGVDTREYPVRMDFDPVMIFRLWRFFRKNKRDILCCNFEKDVRIGGVAAKLAGVQKIFVRKGLALLYDKATYRWAYRWVVDDIITPALSIKKSFKQFEWINQERIHVVPNGVEIPDTAGWSRKYLCNELGVSGECPLVLGAGRLFEQKGFEYFLEAVAKIKNGGKQIACAIAGGGDTAPYEKIARNLKIETDVFFLGERNDLRRLMYGPDIFVLSSIDEGLPNVVLEAMSVGTPVVATRAGDADVIIDDMVNGILAPVKDAGCLAEKIRWLLDNKDMRMRFSEQGLSTVKQRYSIPAMVGSIEKLFAIKTG